MSWANQTEDVSEDVSPPPKSSGPLKGVMLLLLWAPTAWIVFFWAVYLVAEVACVEQPLGSSIGDTALIAFVVASTVVALAGVGGVLLWARGRARGAAADQSLRLIVVLLVACFVVAVVAVGLPALVLDPC